MTTFRHLRTISFYITKMLIFKQNSLADQFTTETVHNNLTTSTAASVSQHSHESDYLFTTYHDYHVTWGNFCINVAAMAMALWIVILNCLLMHTLVKCRAQLEVTDTFIHSLALTDCLNGVLLFYNCLYNIINFQQKYECLARFGLIHSMLMNSTGHISLLTINRYIKIIKPLEYKQIFRKGRMILLSGSVWIFSITLGLSPLFGWSQDYVPTEKDTGYVVCRYFGVMKPGFIASNVSLYWVPLILMIVLYTHVCKIVCRHSREIDAQHAAIGKELGPFTSRSSWRFTKTVFTIIGVYFFCWLPTGVYLIVELSGFLHHIPYTTLGHILTYTTCLGFLNSLFNPIIYATKITCVKQRFQKIFCCKDYRRQSIFSSRRESLISNYVYTISQTSSRRQSSTSNNNNTITTENFCGKTVSTNIN